MVIAPWIYWYFIICTLECTFLNKVLRIHTCYFLLTRSHQWDVINMVNRGDFRRHHAVVQCLVSLQQRLRSRIIPFSDLDPGGRQCLFWFWMVVRHLFCVPWAILWVWRSLILLENKSNKFFFVERRSLILTMHWRINSIVYAHLRSKSLETVIVRHWMKIWERWSSD